MMALGNMRENGVRSLAITCGALWCHHEVILDVSAFADNVSVPAFGPRMVCTICGAIGADARPNWNERALACLFRPKPREQAITDLRPMTGPLKLAVFVALCAIMLVIVIATEGNPLVVIAVLLSAIFLAGRLLGSR